MVRPWVAVLTSFHNTPVFSRIWTTVTAVTLYAALVIWVDQYYLHRVETVGAQFHGFLGLILGTLLVFRTNTSYDRWWEGRKLWGQLVNDIRNLAIKVQTCVRAEASDKQRLGRWLSDFAVALERPFARRRAAGRLAGIRGGHRAAPARAGVYQHQDLRPVRNLAAERPARRLRAAVSRSACLLADEHLRRLRADSEVADLHFVSLVHSAVDRYLLADAAVGADGELCLVDDSGGGDARLFHDRRGNDRGRRSRIRSALPKTTCCSTICARRSRRASMAFCLLDQPEGRLTAFKPGMMQVGLSSL